MKMDRRQIVTGIGTSAAASLFPSVSDTRAVCTADSATKIRIIDASIDLTKTAKNIADAGISTVIRFYSRNANHLDNGKKYHNTVLSKDEWKALRDHDLTVATVFQYSSGGSERSFQNPSKKINDVLCARHSADNMKQPRVQPSISVRISISTAAARRRGKRTSRRSRSISNTHMQRSPKTGPKSAFMAVARPVKSSSRKDGTCFIGFRLHRLLGHC